MIFKRTQIFTNVILLWLFITLVSCMKDDQWVKDHLQQGNLQLSTGGVFVINEGNFMYGNSTLTHYDTLKKEVQNDLFYRVNGLPLGDVAESMTIRESKGFVVINNSGKIYVMDINSGKYTGKITGLISPRFIHIVNNEKAYVTDLYAGKITIVDPATCRITDVIPCPSHPSTEEMVQFEHKLFVTCWSDDKTVIVLDIESNKIMAEITTGEQPCGIVLDRFNKIWVLCQSRPGSISTKPAMLQRIDPLTLKIERSFIFAIDAKPVKLTIDAKGDHLFYLLGNDIIKMAVTSDRLPERSFISLKSKLLYGLGIDPGNGNIYASDALDYQRPGIITRFSESGNPIDTFKAGIIPGRFCFK